MSLTATEIVKRPLITEKSSWEADARNRYAFEVDRRATKTQVKAAVEELYKVRVLKVSTQLRKGEYRRTRFGEVKDTSWKKAVVQLHGEDKIELI